MGVECIVCARGCHAAYEKNDKNLYKAISKTGHAGLYFSCNNCKFAATIMYKVMIRLQTKITQLDDSHSNKNSTKV